jgi:hypothetical protein
MQFSRVRGVAEECRLSFHWIDRSKRPACVDKLYILVRSKRFYPLGDKKFSRETAWINDGDFFSR